MAGFLRRTLCKFGDNSPSSRIPDREAQLYSSSPSAPFIDLLDVGGTPRYTIEQNERLLPQSHARKQRNKIKAVVDGDRARCIDLIDLAFARGV